MWCQRVVGEWNTNTSRRRKKGTCTHGCNHNLLRVNLGNVAKMHRGSGSHGASARAWGNDRLSTRHLTNSAHDCLLIKLYIKCAATSLWTVKSLTVLITDRRCRARPEILENSLQEHSHYTCRAAPQHDPSLIPGSGCLGGMYGQSQQKLVKLVSLLEIIILTPKRGFPKGLEHRSNGSQ